MNRLFTHRFSRVLAGPNVWHVSINQHILSQKVTFQPIMDNVKIIKINICGLFVRVYLHSLAHYAVMDSEDEEGTGKPKMNRFIRSYSLPVGLQGFPLFNTCVCDIQT